MQDNLEQRGVGCKGLGRGDDQVAIGWQYVTYAAGDYGSIQAGVPPTFEHWVDTANGTIVDTVTGLIWLKKADCIHTDWASAGAAVNSLASGQCGLTDGSTAGSWRMPNRDELLSLQDRQENNNGAFFDSTYVSPDGTSSGRRSLRTTWRTVLAGRRRPMQPIPAKRGLISVAITESTTYPRPTPSTRLRCGDCRMMAGVSRMPFQGQRPLRRESSGRRQSTGCGRRAEPGARARSRSRWSREASTTAGTMRRGSTNLGQKSRTR